MKNRNIIKKLEIIRNVHLCLLLFGAAFIAFGSHYIIAILIMLFSFFLDWKLYRCPHCNGELDTRMELNADIHCPHCGKVISSEIVKRGGGKDG